MFLVKILREEINFVLKLHKNNIKHQEITQYPMDHFEPFSQYRNFDRNLVAFTTPIIDDTIVIADILFESNKNEVRAVRGFLNYTLKFLSKNNRQHTDEQSELDKNYFQEEVFFNPFLTNRMALMRNKNFNLFNVIERIDYFGEMNKYVNDKTSIITSYIDKRFFITTEDDEPIAIKYLASFFASYLYILRYNLNFFEPQMQEMRFLTTLWNYHIQNQGSMGTNHLEILPQYRNPIALTTLIVDGTIPINDTVVIDAIKLPLHKEVIHFIKEWRKRIRESEIAFPEIRKCQKEKEVLLIIEEVKKYHSNKMAQRIDYKLLSAFLRYKVKIFHCDPIVKQKEQEMMEETGYTKENIEIIETYIERKKHNIEKNEKYNYSENIIKNNEPGFFNAYLNNRYEIMSNLKNFEKDTPEDFATHVTRYIKDNFVITMDDNDVTDTFLDFFPLLAFFATFEKNVKNADCKEILDLQSQCVRHIKTGRGNTFSFFRHKIQPQSFASLIVRGSVESLLINTPQHLLKKALIIKEIFCELHDKFSEEAVKISKIQKDIARSFFNDELQFCQTNDKLSLEQGRKNHEGLSLPLVMEYMVNVDTTLIQSYINKNKIDKIEKYIQQYAVLYQKKLIDFIKMYDIALKNHNDQKPYGEISDNLEVFAPLLRYIAEQLFWKKITPCLETEKQYKELNKLILLQEISLENVAGILYQNNSNSRLSNQEFFIYQLIKNWSFWLKNRSMPLDEFL